MTGGLLVILLYLVETYHVNGLSYTGFCDMIEQIMPAARKMRAHRQENKQKG